MSSRFPILTVLLLSVALPASASAQGISTLRQNEIVSGFRVEHLYRDSNRDVIAAKFRHVNRMVPVYLLQIETVPQVFMWVDTPISSGQGTAHALEHLVANKGTRGRYVKLLLEMRLSQSVEASFQDYNFYTMSTGAGLSSFLEQFHAWMDALYKADFSDSEAAMEFYHLGVSSSSSKKQKHLVEEGSVYDEMEAGEGTFDYYFALNKYALGESNPLSFNIGGVPDEMRQVAAKDIRSFYQQHYRLGPTTGFIFVISPKENVGNFLKHISEEFHRFPDLQQPQPVTNGPPAPKYPIQPSPDHSVKLFPFPSTGETDRAEVRFAWTAVRTDSRVRLKLLQLFFQALADGQKSILYKSLIDSHTRVADFGATSIEAKTFLSNSPKFPVQFVGLSGIPGNRINVEMVEKLRYQILTKIDQISHYPDHSPALAAFNQVVLDRARTSRRAQTVWIRSAPLFGTSYSTDWKEYLEYLEMDPSFVRSLSEDSTWDGVEKFLKSDTNIWRDLIREYHLLETPYATASVPSPQLLKQKEEEKERRLHVKSIELMREFGTTDEQEALSKFQSQETEKTKIIDQLNAQIRRPHFTENPPLTRDDQIKYQESRFAGVPIIATFFERAPTIDVGLSFDLHDVPRKYYKYLPILPRCLDSLGLKQGREITSYSDLLTKTDQVFYDFSVGYRASAPSRRADLTIRASAIAPEDLRAGLGLIQDMLLSTYLDPANLARMRDLVDERVWQDESFSKSPGWFMNPSYAFRYQDDPLFLAVNSQLTRAHWDGRVKWLLHPPVNSQELDQLDRFAKSTLVSAKGMSVPQFTEHLTQIGAAGLERELLDYWQHNISAFPDSERIDGLEQLTHEVEEDLKVGPAQAIEDLRTLEKMIFTRERLRVDLTLDKSLLPQIRGPLDEFIRSLPLRRPEKPSRSVVGSERPILSKAEKRSHVTGDYFPWFAAIADPATSTASLVFYADLPGYEQVDRDSLIKMLATKLLAGSGPDSFLTKIRENGLAYSSSINSDPSLKLMWYDADRASDLSSLLNNANSLASGISSERDPFMIDYALEQTFSAPRSLSSFSDRGRGLAEDIYDGNPPWKVRRFSEALLKLRRDPNLLSEMIAKATDSISPVLLDRRFTDRQRLARSIFFFVGPERTLDDVERQFQIPMLLRLYPSDFWLQ